MGQLRLSVETVSGGGPLAVEVAHLWNGGWASRNTESVRRHIAELEALGVPPPSTTPIFFPLSSNLAVTADHIEVLGPETSGEVEFALIGSADRWYVTVASDHTDRAFERYGIQVSKQLYPDVLASTVWPLDECASHWDELVLRCWTSTATTELYQEAALADLISARDWLDILGEHGIPQRGLVFLSGTPPTIGGVVFADAYDLELEDPVLQRKIRHRYTVEQLGPGVQ